MLSKKEIKEQMEAFLKDKKKVVVFSILLSVVFAMGAYHCLPSALFARPAKAAVVYKMPTVMPQMAQNSLPHAPVLASEETQLYIPAKDILSCALKGLPQPVVGQELEDQVKLLETQTKEKRQELELKKITEELKSIGQPKEPDMNVYNGRAATAKPAAQPVVEERAIVPPVLASVHKVLNESIATLICQNGEIIRAKQGDRFNEFTVNSIRQDSVVLGLANGKEMTVYMKPPDKYPVNPSIFATNPVLTPPSSMNFQNPQSQLQTGVNPGPQPLRY